jgi:multiple antibiotic resistance protein
VFVQRHRLILLVGIVLLLVLGGELLLPTHVSAAEPGSMAGAQARLVPQIRAFYGNEGSYRGPLKIIPAFLKLTRNATASLRRQLAWRSFFIATATTVVLALVGYKLLIKYNIPLTAIVASAGVVLFLIALRIVLSQYGDDDSSPETPPEHPGLDLALQPLTFPTILTPYGIAVIITVSTLVKEVDGNLSGLLTTLVGIMVLNLLAMLFAQPILKVLKPRVLQLFGLVLGIIQLSLGLTLIFSAMELQALVIKELLAP